MRGEGIWGRVVGNLSSGTACEKALWKLEGSGSPGESFWARPYRGGGHSRGWKWSEDAVV